MTALPDPAGADLSSLPRDADGPVFRAPWEAQAFAIVIGLHGRGAFSWAEWTRTLGAAIENAQAHGDPDRGHNYYRHWLAALETLLAAKGLTDSAERHARESVLRDAAEAAHVPDARRAPVCIG